MAIVALWAAVLIPMWLRRHDDDQARRIERHRLALGTLARFRGAEEVDARSLATRRRRVALLGLAALGVIGSSLWLTGMVPGTVAILMWMPCVAFVPVYVMVHRRALILAHERAIILRREGRRAERVQSLASAQETSEASQSRQLHRSSRPQSHPDVAASDRLPAGSTWEEVFDQTA